MANVQHGSALPRQASGLLAQEIGSETLVYNESTHQAFCLNPVAAQVWKQLGGPQGKAGSRTLAEISAAASVALGAPVTEETVLFALAELRGNGLTEPLPAVAARIAPSRRDLMRQIGAGAIVMLPAVAAVMAPKAAQAYNGCVNCNAIQDKQSVPAPQQRKITATPEFNFLPAPEDTDSNDKLRQKRKQDGEIWIP